MIRAFSAASLSADEIKSAFAVVQAIYPGTDLDSWSVFAQSLIDPKHSVDRAIMGLRAQNGHLCGLFAYRIETSFELQRVLIVDPFAVLDLIEPKQAMRSMLDAIECTAEVLACDAISLCVRSTHKALGSYVASKDYALQAHILTKRRTAKEKGDVMPARSNIGRTRASSSRRRSR